jgi:hypothetical protein
MAIGLIAGAVGIALFGLFVVLPSRIRARGPEAEE